MIVFKLNMSISFFRKKKFFFATLCFSDQVSLLPNPLPFLLVFNPISFGEHPPSLPSVPIAWQSLGLCQSESYILWLQWLAKMWSRDHMSVEKSQYTRLSARVTAKVLSFPWCCWDVRCWAGGDGHLSPGVQGLPRMQPGGGKVEKESHMMTSSESLDPATPEANMGTLLQICDPIKSLV